MKLSPLLRKAIIEIICLLYILLFVYAAVNKLLEFETFKIQLGQSPIIMPYAKVLSVLVPVTELTIAGLLIFSRLRFVGLLLSFSLMTMFTVYIIIILNWSYFIPCSCGGILEKMGWTEHLVFNLVFTILSLVGLLLIKISTPDNQQLYLHRLALSGRKRFLYVVSGVFLLSLTGIFMLYFSAEQNVQRNNAFQRRFPPHPLALIAARPLHYNSYYLAGISHGNIYIGNSTAPLHALQIDTLLKTETSLSLRLRELKKNRYTYLQLRVKDSSFFITDRASSILFRGTIGNWTADQINVTMPPFSSIEPINYNSFAIKTINSTSQEDELAVVRLESDPLVFKNPKLLTKQVDGIFDTDGILLYNNEQKRIIYPYYYRNQYIVANQDAMLVSRNATIDTVKKANIKIARDPRKNESVMAEMPLMINVSAATDGPYLYIKSNRLSKNEPEHILNEASIIDVYNFTKRTYLYSFYIYNYENEKARSFAIRNNLLIVLTDKHIITYRLEKERLNPEPENK